MCQGGLCEAVVSRQRHFSLPDTAGGYCAETGFVVSLGEAIDNSEACCATGSDRQQPQIFTVDVQN